MKRALLHLRLFPGTEETFDRRHRQPPADAVEAFSRSGLRNVTCFRRGTDLWVYAEADSDVDSALERFASEDPYQRWRDSLVDVVAGGWERDQPTRYREVFHSDGPPLAGPFERGMFVLVVHPDRTAEYDDRHANAWPEMLDALAASGFRNYSGFRSGSLVAYYGEFYPDMSTAVANIGATDVNRRWSESFAGIITTITDEHGRLFTARQVFHLE
ncbi:MAG: L-rhamnose mutarotase [Chloroflexota bacterium]|nr:L-rhamnose mutarotase [Chloroflexota bacterium]